MSDRSYLPVETGPTPADVPADGALIPRIDPPTAAPPPKPMGSLVAAAHRLTSTDLSNRRKPRGNSAEGWQDDAWEMYDLVGELRFVTNLLSNQMARARFYVGTLSEDPTAAPVPSEDAMLTDALEAIGDGPSGLTQLLKRIFVNLQIPGDAWLVGIPEWLVPGSEKERPPDGLDNIVLDDLDWHALSVTEVGWEGEDIVLTLGEGPEDKITAPADDVMPIRIWNPHPRRFWQADSATRSALPVLRELVGLTMHISAQIDSRLAGAGVIIVPESAVRAAKIAAGLDPDGEDDPFTDSLIEAMITPIQDRSNASAYVPLVWAVPDDSEPHFRYITFNKPLDEAAKDMRDEAIRRYALSADAPPELLLGVSSMNHWGAWLVKADTVRAHMEPPISLVCDAVTTQYLRPIMVEAGYPEDQIENTVVWYDVEHLIITQDENEKADKAHEAGVISDAAYRSALGFTPEDAPKSAEDPALVLALELVKEQPSLMADPGLGNVVAQIRAVMAGAASPEPITPEPDAPPADSEPNTVPEPIAAAGV